MINSLPRRIGAMRDPAVTPGGFSKPIGKGRDDRTLPKKRKVGPTKP